MIEKYRIRINGKPYDVEVEKNKPLLWVLRDELGLTGTKYGCGIGQCGACTVHLNGTAVRSCGITISTVGDSDITTIEGLNQDHPVLEAWEKVNVPQCGYCQIGQIMTALAFFKNTDRITDNEIDQVMNGNLCRCGTYYRIRKAIKLLNKK